MTEVLAVHVFKEQYEKRNLDEDKYQSRTKMQPFWPLQISSREPPEFFFFFPSFPSLEMNKSWFKWCFSESWDSGLLIMCKLKMIYYVFLKSADPTLSRNIATQ